jgi:hypothetical protein
MTDEQAIKRYYLPGFPPGGPQAPPTGQPRPGHGTVYLTHTSTNEGPWRSLWWASWQDPYDEPGPNGEIVGISEIEGEREEVLAWIRRQPAASFIMPDPEDGTRLVPIPERDEDVILRQPSHPPRRHHREFPPRRFRESS